jgi:polysaccharide export outer membrane protein
MDIPTVTLSVCRAIARCPAPAGTVVSSTAMGRNKSIYLRALAGGSNPNPNTYRLTERLTARHILEVLLTVILGTAVALAVAGCFSGKVVQTRVVEVEDPPDPGPYRIGKGDSLDVLVWGREQLSGRLHVAGDGMITMPLIGETNAAGLTTAELQKQLTHKLSRFVHDPNVTVRVASPASQVFYVLGEVKRAGKYQLAAGEVLSQALAEAGGPTEFANLRKVKIIRYADEKPVEMTVNYNAVASDGDLSADVPISRGDTILVP